MKQYLEALSHILENGESVEDRTGVGTTAVFGYQMRFNLQEGFPAVTTKKLAWRSVVSELLWFLEGSDDERRLAEIHYGKSREELVDKTTIWTANANAQGAALGYTNTDTEKRLGPVYGVQWRSWPTEWRGWDHHGTIDQIQTLIEGLKNDPDSRRHILSAWNVAEIDKMALPPCHTLAQFRVMNGKLSCQLYQRSADMGLGVPFNIASYSLLTHMLAQICDLNVGDFVWSGGDCHIYNNHIPAIKEQIKREPKTLPSLTMPKFDSLETLLETKPTDYVLNDYEPMSSIKMDMAV